ncbi:MAG TPA: nickel-dependent hydrogenase large subunit [Myxococcales bacterium]|nr:nickel-dependent hydrogenase large subunit [Myxococcales bacterium]
MSPVTIPVGPQHPALKEPESFDITLEGERILGVTMRLGYNHRGIEKACEARSWVQDLFLLERICGICSHAHSTAFCMAVEDIASLQVPPRAQFIRTLVGELERIHSHLLWLGVAGHEIGLDTLMMYAWRDRETVMDLLALLTGNRVNYGINLIGGVRRDVSAEQLEQVLRSIDFLEQRVRYYVEVARTESTLHQRLAGVGPLSMDDARRLGAIGPTGRASMVDRDTRRDDPYLAYGEVQFKVITDWHCDVYGRTLVRLGELLESFSIIRQLAARLPAGPLKVKAPRKVPAGQAVARYEAPRGEDLHFVRSNGTERPERVKVRAPTLANLASVAKMLENHRLADVPIVIAAIDPCFSCTDRAVRLARSAGCERLSWAELRQHGIDWYRREAGLDLAALDRRLAAHPPPGGPP